MTSPFDGAKPETAAPLGIAAGGLLLLTLALAGCGGGGSSSSSVPGAPTIGAATAGNASASVAFTAPSSDGGSTITGYTVSCTGGGATRTGTGTSSPIAVTSLTNATAYACAVTATNAVGTSAASASVSVTPVASATGATGTTSGLPTAFSQFGANVTVVYNASAGTVTLEAAGRPDHKSPYWNPAGTSGLYVAAGPETTVAQMSPGYIDQYTNKYFLTVSTHPQKASKTTATGLGAIGIAITGSPIFNGQEGPNVNLDSGVISGFDNYGAHTGPQVYHYHLEPTPISNDDNKLIAILRDGFFLYGRKCASTGDHPTDLDASGGHTSITQYATTPVYHYHIKNQVYMTVNSKSDYMLFDGAYQGTPASITN